jgi:hypothetical protein
MILSTFITLLFAIYSCLIQLIEIGQGYCGQADNRRDAADNQFKSADNPVILLQVYHFLPIF